MANMHRNLTADRRASKGETVSFEVDGVTYHAVPDAPGGAFMDLAEQAATPGPAQVKATNDFLDACLTEESTHLFAANMRRKTSPMVTQADIGNVIAFLVEVYSGRPPEQLSPSSLPPPANGASSPVAAPQPVSTP